MGGGGTGDLEGSGGSWGAGRAGGKTTLRSAPSHCGHSSNSDPLLKHWGNDNIHLPYMVVVTIKHFEQFALLVTELRRSSQKEMAC